MFVEDGLSWDNEREPTALDWPPLLTPGLAEESRPDAARNDVVIASEAAAAIVFHDDGRIDIPADPDLTEAELRATSIDSMVGASFLPHETADAEPVASTDDIVERPPRSSRRKRSLIIVGAAVTVGLSFGYTAKALGLRLPPAVLASAQPMTTFVRGLTAARALALVERLRFAATGKGAAPSGEPEMARVIAGPMSDPDGIASQPMSLLEDAEVQRLTMSLPPSVSTLQSALANDEGAPAPALLEEARARDQIVGGRPSRTVAYVLPSMSHRQHHLAHEDDGAASSGSLVETASRSRHRTTAHKEERHRRDDH
jgi:hypothetical protein